MWQTTKAGALAFHRTFHNSLVILFARLQLLAGAAWAVLSVTDLAPIIGNPKYVTAWLIFAGVVTEMSRRQGTCVDERNRLLPVSATAPVVVPAPAPTDTATK